MKTLNFELSKRLNDLGLLDNIETEYLWYQNNETGNYDIVDRYEIIGDRTYIYKTLTLEEVIDFLININLSIEFFNRDGEIWCGENNGDGTYKKGPLIGKTPLEAIEKMLEYLLDNNLIGQEKN